MALDRSEGELKDAPAVVGGMLAAGESGRRRRRGGVVKGTRSHLPLPDGAFDAVIASEVLEHVWDDTGALRELVRVLRPGGRLAVTVPTRWPERVCWALDYRYHDTPGGHVRIYHQHELEAKIEAAGCWLLGSHHARSAALPLLVAQVRDGRAPRRPALGRAPLPRLLPREIAGRAPALASLEQALNPVLGKSLVVYGQRCEP